VVFVLRSSHSFIHVCFRVISRPVVWRIISNQIHFVRVYTSTSSIMTHAKYPFSVLSVGGRARVHAFRSRIVQRKREEKRNRPTCPGRVICRISTRRLAYLLTVLLRTDCYFVILTLNRNTYFFWPPAIMRYNSHIYIYIYIYIGEKVQRTPMVAPLERKHFDTLILLLLFILNYFHDS